ncbi:FAD-dependent oxidoreductase [Legionella taurinensis]|uniref:FAD-dependent oxidoreductase n=1 Tax=Legionella taurinensis TaxID=70611 RepID=A0A3A5LJF2_9GAMM|nr:FAD-dependent oxidoreductase [Legionella taurinensis]RJT48182.1 FAD-dependent oxidoreductase [Legionella taurinensis]RJT69154.1 FAD-dependent oxidoreductase [Legionella taurinensis]STY25920.1 Monomeric sarcosine oxidase [Legionella taurinensis]
MKSFFDKNEKSITIIGCGIAGASLAYQLSKQASEKGQFIKIRVIEKGLRENTPNPHGSSHGNARITRIATAEGKEYIPYAKRSQEIIASIEKETKQSLHIRSGGLIIGPQDDGSWPLTSAQYARENGIPCEIKNPDELTRYDALKIGSKELAYFEPSMGMLIPEKCHRILIELAENAGVEFIFDECYQGFEEKIIGGKSTVLVHTDKRTYASDEVVLSMGPWLQKELSEHFGADVSEQLSVHMCSMYTFKITDEFREKYSPKNCPVLIWQKGQTEAFVFFPDVNGEGRVQFALFPISDLKPNALSPDSLNEKQAMMPPEEVFNQYIAPNFNGISSDCVSVINYPFTMNKKERFIYDSLPDHPQVKIMDVGSAHGYKHAIAFGEQVAQNLLLGKSTLGVENTFGSFFNSLKQSLTPRLIE